jgi:hypothetical protein
MDSSTASIANAIRDRIVETVFEKMFREAGNHIVVPIGYDYTAPELAEHSRHPYVKKVLDNLRSAPDFVLISNDRTEVFVVEVQYRASPYPNDLEELAFSLLRRWDPSYIFLATPQGFYFDSCQGIRERGSSNIAHLSERWIRQEIQLKYLDILHHFVR